VKIFLNVRQSIGVKHTILLGGPHLVLAEQVTPSGNFLTASAYGVRLAHIRDPEYLIDKGGRIESDFSSIDMESDRCIVINGYAVEREGGRA
jgi:hypothetical protein